MFFCHVPQIWKDFPQLVPAVLQLDNIHPQVTVSQETHLAPLFDRARQRLAQSPESQFPEIAAWRKAYSAMGLKPTKYRSAAEALLRRFKREDDLPRLHPLVDLCNTVSLAFSLPVAVFDLDNVDGFLEVRYADGDEAYLAFSGDTEHPAPGEVIFADAGRQVHARRWTFRQSRQSTVSDRSRRVLIVSEALHDTALADEQALRETLTGYITDLWGAPRQQAILSADSPRFEMKL
jgi:DNA/RNA-binding domain of Phe-tRNA-synthetase-like protein